MEQRRHLIDKGPGPASAGAVHTMLVTACEICNFSVFAAQFDNNVCLRMVRADGLCTGNDLLNKRDMQMVSQSHAAGSCNSDGNLAIAEYFIGVFQKIQYFLTNICVMPDIAGVKTLF